MKVYFINTDLVVQNTPEIFTPTPDNIFDKKYCDGGNVGSEVEFYTMDSFATIRCRVLPNKTYKIINIGNSNFKYANRMSYADSNNKLVKYIEGGTNYSDTFTVPDNSNIYYAYLSLGFMDPVPEDKQLETSTIINVD